ncbi:hypothetical protein Dfri01_09570 [Dyadobacter frigoris]|nr:hypothetical protein Dfri01_09570 [Dyadobacter frigoris]
MTYGTEFIPKLNEGAIYVRATLPNSINLEQSVKTGNALRDTLRSFQEVKFVMSQTGRPNDGTDPTGFFNNEFHIQLKAENQWERPIKKDELLREMKEVLASFPGITFGFSQPIQDNVEEYVAGVKSSLVVKIFGNDLVDMESKADQVAENLQKVRGVSDVLVYRNIGIPELAIRLDEHGWRAMVFRWLTLRR